MILHKWYLPMPKENLSIYSVCIGRNIIGVFRCLKKKNMIQKSILSKLVPSPWSTGEAGSAKEVVRC